MITRTKGLFSIIVKEYGKDDTGQTNKQLSEIYHYRKVKMTILVTDYYNLQEVFKHPADFS